MTQKLTTEQRRKFRVRNKIRKLTQKTGKPRLSVHRTNTAIYAQVIDDAKGVTLASASTLDADVKKAVKGNGGNTEAAKVVGKLVAERATKAGVKKVIFDRGQFLFHGRVKALAEGAREGKLEF
ncbi:MAG: 50S ribosomal protein L18 [Micavibrio sp.]|nr:50S ribosomal protein L18 [Micavibrio sp.]|tara:strand:- start:1540 stop:1911 length:372 start_codon:yes stop_codon:yes gene_type:complete